MKRTLSINAVTNIFTILWNFEIFSPNLFTLLNILTDRCKVTFKYNNKNINCDKIFANIIESMVEKK